MFLNVYFYCFASVFWTELHELCIGTAGGEPARTVPHSSLEILTSAHFKYVIDFFLYELRELAFMSQSYHLGCKYTLLVAARHGLTES